MSGQISASCMHSSTAFWTEVLAIGRRVLTS